MAQGARRPIIRPGRHSRQGQSLSNNDHTASVQPPTKQVSATENDVSRRDILSIISDQPADKRNPLGEEELPTITGYVELDFELNALLALILKLCIQSWYGLITSDREMNGQLVGVIVHSIKVMQTRLSNLDLNLLVLDEIPDLLVQHLDAIKVAQEASSDQHRFREIFHAIRTHPALEPIPDTAEESALQQEHQAAWSQMLVDKLLPMLLPVEDVQNPGLAVIVREILAEMILHNGVCNKVAEPWFLWESIGRGLFVLKPADPKTKAQYRDVSPVDTIGQTMLTVWAVLGNIWLVLNMGSLRLVTQLVQQISVSLWRAVTSGGNIGMTHAVSITSSEKDSTAKRPLIEARLWSCVARLTGISQRMPWLNASLSLMQWTLLRSSMVGGEGSILDRWAQAQIDTRLYDVTVWPSILRIARQSLFPGGKFAAARPMPDPTEIIEIRQACAKAISDCIPARIRTIYFASMDSDKILQDIDMSLDVLADAYVNKALIISIVELLVARLFPELA